MSSFFFKASLVGRPSRTNPVVGYPNGGRIFCNSQINCRLPLRESNHDMKSFNGRRNFLVSRRFFSFASQRIELTTVGGSGFDSYRRKGISEPQEIRVLGVFDFRKLRFVFAMIACGMLVVRCNRVLATTGVVDAGVAMLGAEKPVLRALWPKLLQVLNVLRDQGLVLAALLGLSAFFSMAETAITTLWPWKILEANVRKVGKVRFKAVSNKDSDAEVKGVNRVVSKKVIKRKTMVFKSRFWITAFSVMIVTVTSI